MASEERAAILTSARSLVGHVTIIKAAARLLEGYWERLSEDERNRMLADITAQADGIRDQIEELVRAVHDTRLERREVVDLRAVEAPAASASRAGED